MDPRPSPAVALVGRYEALRGSAGEETGDEALGRALLMRQGLASWIETWGACQLPPAPQLEGVPDGPAGAGGPPRLADVLPAGARGQVARVLTGMAVAALGERRA